MNKLKERLLNVPCFCKNEIMVHKSCIDIPVCFSSIHPYGNASVEQVVGTPEVDIDYNFTIPVFVAEYDGNMYLSYDENEFKPIRTNRYYYNPQKDNPYVWIEVDNNGKIVDVNPIEPI